MDHDLSAHSSSSPYPQHSREPSTLDSNQSAAPALSLQDYLASVMSSGTISAALPPPAASGYEAFASPPADEQQNAQPVNFADILAEFTLAQNAFSPDTSGNRGGGDSSAESTSPNLAPTNGNRSDKTGSQQEEQQPAPAAQAKSAQEILLEQLKALYPAAPAPTPAAPSHHAQPPPPCQQQQQHSSQVEAHPSPHSQHGSTYAPSPSSSSSHGVQLGAEMQAQLQQWLAQSMPTNHSNTTSSDADGSACRCIRAHAPLPSSVWFGRIPRTGTPSAAAPTTSFRFPDGILAPAVTRSRHFCPYPLCTEFATCQSDAVLCGHAARAAAAALSRI